MARGAFLCLNRADSHSQSDSKAGVCLCERRKRPYREVKRESAIGPTATGRLVLMTGSDDSLNNDNSSSS